MALLAPPRPVATTRQAAARQSKRSSSSCRRPPAAGAVGAGTAWFDKRAAFMVIHPVQTGAPGARGMMPTCAKCTALGVWAVCGSAPPACGNRVDLAPVRSDLRRMVGRSAQAEAGAVGQIPIRQQVSAQPREARASGSGAAELARPTRPARSQCAWSHEGGLWMGAGGDQGGRGSGIRGTRE